MRPATEPHVSTQHHMLNVLLLCCVVHLRYLVLLALCRTAGAPFLGCPSVQFREGGWGRANSVVTGLTSLFGMSMINKQVLVLCSDACETFRDESWHPCGGGLETILSV